jgi:two-component system nitrogen regulation sensor histidine kinase NtrY
LRRPLAEAVPELSGLVGEALGGAPRLVQGQVTLARQGRERNLNVRVTTELSPEDSRGFVVTLDDITDLVTAQRSSAWADVARRIAHEIKNPLTPIQLSAERIRRRVSKMLETEPAGREVIEQCTDTIVRQVETIQHMVNEFSSFARMPKPAITEDNLADMARKVVLDMRVGYPDLEIDFSAPDEPVLAVFDRRLLSQALGNIIKNATEAVSAMAEEERGPGRIDVVLRRLPERIEIDVVDNGPGFPKKDRQRLLEPYMTTREKGTGLGLAIVTKIIEEHGGSIELLDSPEVQRGGHGALIRITFPAIPAGTNMGRTPEVEEVH